MFAVCFIHNQNAKSQPHTQYDAGHAFTRASPLTYNPMASMYLSASLPPSLPLPLPLPLQMCLSLPLHLPIFFQQLPFGSSQWEQSSVPCAATEEDSEELSISNRPSFIHKNKWTPACRLDETQSLFSSNPVASPLLLEGAFDYRGVALHCSDE